MVLVHLSKFREYCSYCYTNIDTGVNVCECDISVCDNHLCLHREKAGCSVLYKIIDNNGIQVESEFLSDDQKVEVIKNIQLLLKCNNYDEKVIFKDDEKECPDILHIKLNNLINIGKLDETHCRECEVSKHLYICFTCGYIGCGRVQYGIEGNGHAQHHYNMSGHPIFVLISSITPEYVCDTYCYKCEDFIINPICDKKISCLEFSAPGKSWIDNQFKKEDNYTSVESPFVGIKNGGNTCFISTVLQLIGFICAREQIDFNQHFTLCDTTNPMDCLYCQSCRVFNEMKLKKVNPYQKVISIVDLLKLIWKRFPMFTKNVQHDANEFFIMYMQILQEGEFIGLFPKFSHLISFQTESFIHCDKCKYISSAVSDNSIIYTPFDNDFQFCLDEYFKDLVTDCECGGSKIICNRIVSYPKYLISTVGRCKFENDSFVKIVSSLGVDKINLEKYLKKPSLANYFIEELKSKGYTESEIYLALSMRNDFENKEELILDYKKNNRTDPEYNIQGSIVHTGISMDSGHYMWFVKDNGIFYLVNDRMVTEEGVEYLEQSYILCLY